VINFRETDIRILEHSGSIFRSLGSVLLPEVFTTLAACCDRELALRNSGSSQTVMFELPPLDPERLHLAISAIRGVISDYDRRFFQPSSAEAEAWGAMRKFLAQLLASLESFMFTMGEA
jgi:hypothetical protein